MAEEKKDRQPLNTAANLAMIAIPGGMAAKGTAKAVGTSAKAVSATTGTAKKAGKIASETMQLPGKMAIKTMDKGASFVTKNPNSISGSIQKGADKVVGLPKKKAHASAMDKVAGQGAQDILTGSGKQLDKAFERQFDLIDANNAAAKAQGQSEKIAAGVNSAATGTIGLGIIGGAMGGAAARTDAEIFEQQQAQRNKARKTKGVKGN